MAKKRKAAKAKSTAKEQKKKSPEVPAPETKKTSASEPGRAFMNAHYFLFLLIIVVLVGCYNIIRPYLHTIILAMILAVIFTPVNKKLEHLLKGRKNTAAAFSCILLTLVVVLPVLFMLLAIIQQGIDSFDAIYTWVESGKYQALSSHPLVTRLVSWGQGVLPDIERFFPDFNVQALRFDEAILNVTRTIGKALLNQGGNLAGGLTSFVGKFFLMLFAFFFFVRDEEVIFDSLLHLIPLSSSQESRIIDKIKTVSKSALLGTFVTALAQGLAGGIAFWITGLPALFWGIAMAFASLVPLVGTALIWIPAAIFLLISGHWGYAIFMTVWSVVVVGMIDNIVRPLFMQGAADMSTLLIFFAILGGINYFGLIGLLYGPIIFGLAMVLLYIYSIEFDEFLNQQDNR
ncbi:AI-2E family transporter [Desulfoluna spongiiphila]|uniref:Predicted PurR-regulated permease PerM n=1 Tax=Desulfoluna spongiiphila TaxID=419481 RepID=A0A1G5IKP2_9BACT|nr:AI-2E family transporter [Desulfoluna spongiiphila]SCY76524.1 Predicted PurR-regulated permease PerM [Desulfoluna spongiiphila]VVS90962.1 consensus disorder prediction [Desulfoluna spongiiphila]